MHYSQIWTLSFLIKLSILFFSFLKTNDEGVDISLSTVSQFGLNQQQQQQQHHHHQQASSSATTGNSSYHEMADQVNIWMKIVHKWICLAWFFFLHFPLPLNHLSQSQQVSLALFHVLRWFQFQFLSALRLTTTAMSIYIRQWTERESLSELMSCLTEMLISMFE